MNQHIAEQKKQIQEKEALIKQKNDQLKATEQEYEHKLEALAQVYDEECRKKADLDAQLQSVKRELEDIETQFPKEITDLKTKITEAKKQTEEFEEKTKVLAEDLRKLKGQSK